MDGSRCLSPEQKPSLSHSPKPGAVELVFGFLVTSELILPSGAVNVCLAFSLTTRLWGSGRSSVCWAAAAVLSGDSLWLGASPGPRWSSSAFVLLPRSE